MGTLTGRLGDPSGRDRTRPVLTEAAVAANAAALLAQCHRVLLPGFRAHHNHAFVEGMSVPTFLVRLAGRFTVAGLLARDGFRARWEAGAPIAAHELLVPLIQGWDSVVLRTEVEIGGTDQLFNFQIARRLQRAEGQAAQVALMKPLIAGADGRKMSKSLGNTVWLDEPPESMFAQIMAIRDAQIDSWRAHLTDLRPGGSGPMSEKLALAEDIVAQLHGAPAAALAAAAFERIVRRKGLPDEVPEVAAGDDLVALVARVREVSRSGARKLIVGRGVRIDGACVVDPLHVPRPGDVVRIGKRHAVKIGAR